jgi:hypothetical protein
VVGTLAAQLPPVDPLDESGGRLWISIMAGVTLADLRTAIAPVDPGCRIVRTMPNTPMKVRGGGGFTTFICRLFVFFFSLKDLDLAPREPERSLRKKRAEVSSCSEERPGILYRFLS